MGRVKLEKFLYVLETGLQEKMTKDSNLPTAMDITLEFFFEKLVKNKTEVIVPTDQANGHHFVASIDCINLIHAHMKKVAIPICHQEIVLLHHGAAKKCLSPNC
eukprot:7998607-Ditylum_brightwellii.AAC.1